MKLLLKKKTSRKSPTLKTQALDFISAGVGCNCLVALFEAGLLKRLTESGYLEEEEIAACSNPICIDSALVTLENCKIVKKNGKVFEITEFGRALSEYIGLITIFFDGYSGLVAEQSKIVKDKGGTLEKLIKWPTVSESSIWISKKTVLPVLVEELLTMKLVGTICDLGCGHGETLSEMCLKTGSPGLGFESSKKTVSQARKRAPPGVTIQVSDVTRLEGVWEDVVILTQAFVFHDFAPNAKCINIMNSYLDNFPNLKCFFYIDIVSASPGDGKIFPGFDYVHGLLGLRTRTYQETLEMFERSNYAVMREISIVDLPNTFLWVLTPQKAKCPL